MESPFECFPLPPHDWFALAGPDISLGRGLLSARACRILVQEALYRIRGLRAILQPVADTVLFDVELLRLR